MLKRVSITSTSCETKHDTQRNNFILQFVSDDLVTRRLAGIPDFISGDDMDEMISSGRLDPKVVFAYVQEVYRALKDN